MFSQEHTRTAWTETPVPAGAVPGEIVDQANRELDVLCETLTRYGAIVYRPGPMDFVSEQGM